MQSATENITKNNVWTYSVNDWNMLLSFVDVFRFGRWIFRGHSNSKWELKSSFDRHRNRRKLTVDDYKFICSRCNVQSHVEALAILQHYGYPTRLMDFTYSFSIALYFALERKDLSKKPSIWCINMHQLMESTRENAKDTRFLANTDNSMSHTEMWKSVIEAERHYKYDTYITEYCNKRVDEILHDNKDDEHIYPVILPNNNPRLDAQNGLFLFQGTRKITMKKLLEESLKVNLDLSEKQLKNELSETDIHKIQHQPIIKLELSDDMPGEIDNFLKMLNVLPVNIYPDREGLVRQIAFNHKKWKCKPEKNTEDEE